MIKARTACAACALAIVGAGSTACGALWPPALIHRTASPVTQLSTSCRPGYISQDATGKRTFKPGGSADANSYELTFTNPDHSQTAIVEEVGVGFYDTSGADIGSDTSVGSKTVASGNIPVAPGQSLSVIFYRPDSGISAKGSSPPGTWVLDDHMPSGTTRCQVLSSSVGY